LDFLAALGVALTSSKDLKPGNVLVDRYHGQLKIIDFGQSRRESAFQDRVQDVVGTYRWQRMSL